MVRTNTDDKPATEEAFDIIDEARDVLGEDDVADTIGDHDGDVRLAAADLADAVVAEEERRQAEVRNDEPTAEDIAESFGVDTDDVDVDDVEVPDTPDKVDVSDYKTAHGAAKATFEALQEWAEVFGHDADEVVMYDPEETRAKRDMRTDADVYTVAWEGGPSEWASALTGGESLDAFTHFGSFGNDPQVAGLTNGDGFNVECYYSFDLQFFNK